ncbi:hypothetical protein [Spirochaeta isovalerica]|uniref:Lipoprotein n=1 Tax=Spirochaeta isovalerica TaxID=150 RepID=A0A841R8Z0_9SPIO|nr:hypothetical protein [Spirochaeta isovalerica]MBB6481764.1 hypothetical protein [Spirochaeta isovalerica]
MERTKVFRIDLFICLLSVTTGCKQATDPDVVNPTAGGGTITTTGITSTSETLIWTKGTVENDLPLNLSQ